jgi:basic membrane protein A and related proteins
MRSNMWRYLAAPFVALVLVASACGDDDDETTAAGDTTADTAGESAETTAAESADTTAAPEGGATTVAAAEGPCPGTEGCVPENQPDVNQDGTVRIGVLSPGDTNDNGYYESFVVTANQFADENGWELVIVDKINPADAQEQARNICRQDVDMVAIAAGELADAVPVAEEDVCAGTVWYVSGGAGIEQTPYFFQTADDVVESQYTAGVATGLAMQELGVTKAGFVTGPELDFSINAFNAWTAGIKSVLPDAETVATYTGDFDDSAVGREGAQAQLDQDVGILYPYLGGATDAVAQLGLENDVLSVTPGTDRCAEEAFAVSSIFSPGDFFATALEDFEAGNVQLGITRVFRIGVDSVPNVKICDTVPNAAELQAQADEVMQQIAAGDIDPQAETEAVAG